jgi:hypothetical protein
LKSSTVTTGGAVATAATLVSLTVLAAVSETGFSSVLGEEQEAKMLRAARAGNKAFICV